MLSFSPAASPCFCVVGYDMTSRGHAGSVPHDRSRLSAPNAAGFSLVELLAVVAVILLLLTLLFP